MATLALDRVLQRKLAAASLELLSTRAAWDALETVSLVEFELLGCVNGETGREAYHVLQALGARLEVPQGLHGTVH